MAGVIKVRLGLKGALCCRRGTASSSTTVCPSSDDFSYHRHSFLGSYVTYVRVDAWAGRSAVVSLAVRRALYGRTASRGRGYFPCDNEINPNGATFVVAMAAMQSARTEPSDWRLDWLMTVQKLHFRVRASSQQRRPLILGNDIDGRTKMHEEMHNLLLQSEKF